MSNSTRTPIKRGGLGEPLAQYRNRDGRLLHPDPGQVFACPDCGAASTRLEAEGDTPPWCSKCGAQFARDEIVVRPADYPAGLDPEGRALWRADPDTPVSDLSDLEVDR